MEMNPDSVVPQDLTYLRNEGVNRASLGMQSANDDILKLIGRRHTSRQTESAFKALRAAGFDNISLDLIYGLPSQSKNDWANSLSRAIAMQPQHLSCYGLKIEEGTPICKYVGSQFLPTDDDQADMYLYMTDTLDHYGYRQYEISNFSLPGKMSKHNLKYWTLQDYMGFGPGAHSCVDSVRYSYRRDLNGYIAGIMNDGEIIDEYEKIDKDAKAAEYIMLGMRTVRGISRGEYQELYRSSFDGMEYLLSEYEKRGWAKKVEDRWRFTSSGFLLSNPLIATLLETQSQEKMSAAPWIQEKLSGDTEEHIKTSAGGAEMG